MILKDFHMHTTYCDGKHTPEQMILAAIEKNMDSIGICTHSYTFFEEAYCINKDKAEDYKSEISLLKQKYADKIKVFCGVEQDYYSQMDTEGFDYVIGSVHYLKKGTNYLSVDESADILKANAKKYFDGDFYAMAEQYFKTVSDVANKTGANIVGHFDLIAKFNEKEGLFDENDERYINAGKKAIETLVKKDVIFEVNTGAISRGHKSVPYPGKTFLKYIYELGGKVILSSDAHSAENLCFEFDKWEKMCAEIGFEFE